MLKELGDYRRIYGEVNGTVQYLGKAGDKWLGVPTCIGSQIKGPCSRIDLMKQHAGIDVQVAVLTSAETLQRIANRPRRSAEAGLHLLRRGDPEDREAVRDALPVLLPADFPEAAWRIRQAAARLPI